MLEIGMKLNGWSTEKDFWYELAKLHPDYEKQRFSTEGFLELAIGEQEIINFQEDDDLTKTIAKTQVRKETEKAIEILIESTTREYWDGELEDEYTEKYSYWLPKSQIKIEENKISLPEWLAEKKHLTKYGKKVSVVTKLG